jgi:hypothetical protein
VYAVATDLFSPSLLLSSGDAESAQRALVDSTDLIIITSVVQTVVITLTLVVFIFQFRSQEKSNREAAVANVMGRYTDYVGRLVDRPELASILDTARAARDGEPGTVEKLSPEEQSVQAYILLGYGLLEEVYSLYKKKWMDEETWSQWSAFLERISAHPAFRRVHKFTSGTFDKDFQDFVTKTIEESDRKRKRG